MLDQHYPTIAPAQIAPINNNVMQLYNYFVSLQLESDFFSSQVIISILNLTSVTLGILSAVISFEGLLWIGLSLNYFANFAIPFYRLNRLFIDNSFLISNIRRYSPNLVADYEYTGANYCRDAFCWLVSYFGIMLTIAAMILLAFHEKKAANILAVIAPIFSQILEIGVLQRGYRRNQNLAIIYDTIRIMVQNGQIVPGAPQNIQHPWLIRALTRTSDYMRNIYVFFGHTIRHRPAIVISQTVPVAPAPPPAHALVIAVFNADLNNPPALAPAIVPVPVPAPVPVP